VPKTDTPPPRAKDLPIGSVIAYGRGFVAEAWLKNPTYAGRRTTTNPRR